MKCYITLAKLEEGLNQNRTNNGNSSLLFIYFIFFRKKIESKEDNKEQTSYSKATLNSLRADYKERKSSRITCDLI